MCKSISCEINLIHSNRTTRVKFVSQAEKETNTASTDYIKQKVLSNRSGDLDSLALSSLIINVLQLMAVVANSSAITFW